MTIKVSVEKVIDKEYSAKMKKKEEATSRMAAAKVAVDALKDHVNLQQERLGTDLSAMLKKARDVVKQVGEVHKEKRVVKVVSDKTWMFVDEFECPDSGRTLYGKIEDYVTVDEVPLRFNGKLKKLKLDEEYALVSDMSMTIKEQLAMAKAKAIELIKQKRAIRKEIPFQMKDFAVRGMPYKAQYKVYAGGGTGGENGPQTKYFIHMEKGEILKLKEAAKLRRVFEPKTPKTNAHHVGIEIEFISKTDKFQLAQILAKNNVTDFVELKDDGSLRADEKDGHKYCHELCVMAPEALIHEVLRRVINSLDEAGSKVNGRCGLHVHIDVRNRDRSLVFNNLVKSQNVLYMMNPKSRLDGTRSDGKKDTAYSVKVNIADFDIALRDLRGSKYNGINPLTYERLKTIEVRLHGGSTNFTKISNWVKILTNIANDNNKYSEDVDSAEEFCERLQLNDTMLGYIQERINKFKDKSGKHITMDEAS